MLDTEQFVIHKSKFVDYSPANIAALSFSHRSNAEKLTPSALRLAIGRSNGNIEIWNPRNNWFNEMTIQGGKDRSIEGLCWCNMPGEPLRLFSIGGSTVVTEWDLATGLPFKNFDCNAGVIWSLAINESQTQLSVGCDNGAVVIIDITGGRGVMEFDYILVRQEARILTLAWKNDDYVIGGCSDGRIRIWNTQKEDENKGRLLHTMRVDKSKKESTLVWCVLFLPHTNQIVSGDSTGSIIFWDFHYATLSQSFKSHEADVLCLTTNWNGTHVFSAGVDRKIYQFGRSSNNSQTNNSTKWVPLSNRLFHGNDVRAMTSFQSKGADLLVSGGIEKNLVISSLSNMSDGNYQKIPLLVPFGKNIISNKEQRLVVMWQESTVKVWVLGDDLHSPKNYKLVCKMTLADEQHITTCAMSPDGQVLVVCRPNTTKLFHLQSMDGKLKVTKLENEMLLKTGIKLAKFVDNSKIIFCTVDDEIMKMDLEAEDDEDATEIELPTFTATKGSYKVPYFNKINHLDVFGDHAVITRGCGSVDLINLATEESKTILRLMNFISSISFIESRNTIVAITVDNKIYEMSINSDSDDENSTLTAWSKNNTQNLPHQIQSLKEKCLGIFSSPDVQDKIWLWGTTWLCRIDLSMDFPINKRNKTKKRSRDTLTVTDESTYANDDSDEDDDEDMNVTESLELTLADSNKLTPVHRAKKEKDLFFFTTKYKSVLHMDLLSNNELIVVERPQAMLGDKQAGFALPKFIF